MGRTSTAQKAALELEPIAAGTAPTGTTALATVDASPANMMVELSRAGMKADEIGAMLAVQREWEANEARKAYVAAMAGFGAEPLVIEKRKVVDFTSSKGRTHYTHAGLDDVTRVVKPALARHGLSHRFSSVQNGREVTVTCTITHRLGHSESVTMSSPFDDSGNKNSLQQLASSTTYLSRYTLMMICGLASEDMQDDDGRAGGSEPVPTISEAQQATLADMIEATKTNKKKLLEWLGVEQICDIPAARFDDAMAVLREREKAAGVKS